jgi:hypothetical protein
MTPISLDPSIAAGGRRKIRSGSAGSTPRRRSAATAAPSESHLRRMRDDVTEWYQRLDRLAAMRKADRE